MCLRAGCAWEQKKRCIELKKLATQKNCLHVIHDNKQQTEKSPYHQLILQYQISKNNNHQTKMPETHEFQMKPLEVPGLAKMFSRIALPPKNSISSATKVAALAQNETPSPQYWSPMHVIEVSLPCAHLFRDSIICIIIYRSYASMSSVKQVKVH